MIMTTQKKNMYKLSTAGCLRQDGQTSAFLRSHTVSWEPKDPDTYYLEYSYNRKDWYALNGGNSIPCGEITKLYGSMETLDSCEPSGEEISISSLEKLQEKYGAPEPVFLAETEIISAPSSEEACGAGDSIPKQAEVRYTNGMTEMRKVICREDGYYLAPHEYAAPFISHRADPYVYKHTDGKYYFIASHTDAGHNLDGKYQYLYLILRCADTLEDLTDNSGRYREKIVYEKAPIGDGTKSPHLWAPEIHMIQGRWYIYYTATISDESSWRIRPHCLECSGMDPMEDPWVEKGPIRTTVEGDIAFTDFSLDHTYFHHNGVDYFLWAQKTNNISDIFIAKLENPWTICTPSVKLTTPEYNWELHGFAVNEGPAVLTHDGRVFVTFSASGTDAMYCMGLLYADLSSDLLDADSWHKLPYPVFQSSPATGIYGPGHNSFTRSTDDSEQLIIYHGRQEERYLGEGDYQPLYDAGRNAYVGKVFWNADGMPSFSIPEAPIAANPEDLKLRTEN